ncbi:hypothetical protein [Pseudomonas veronii]|uniref:hypothetical protein n=1 Tax=Pseudomonas veronii TaxID=76761 RepID=UPI000F832960|nr:hypothetical protein [Pseudomonas veronii]RTY77160.1 hypothetical protein EKA83_13040 [Pseudomonas veronii]
MLSGKIKVTFEVPSPLEAEEGMRPFVSINTMDIVDAAIESGLPDHSPLLNLIHQAGEDLDLQDLFEEHVMSWEPENRPAAADEIAEWLENLARVFRKGSEQLSLDLKPRLSPGPRN